MWGTMDIEGGEVAKLWLGCTVWEKNKLKEKESIKSGMEYKVSGTKII